MTEKNARRVVILMYCLFLFVGSAAYFYSAVNGADLHRFAIVFASFILAYGCAIILNGTGEKETRFWTGLWWFILVLLLILFLFLPKKSFGAVNFTPPEPTVIYFCAVDGSDTECIWIGESEYKELERDLGKTLIQQQQEEEFDPAVDGG